MTEHAEKPAAHRVPRFASDIARSWLAIAIWLPLLVVIIWLFATVPLGLPAWEDPSALFSGAFTISWSVFCAFMAILTIATFARASGTELRRWLDATAPPSGWLRRFAWSFNGGGAIWWALTGSAVALWVLLDLALSGRETHPLFVAAAISSVPASIAVIIVSFAVSHARLDGARGLEFPGTPTPRFTDYLYLSVMVTTSFGASDIAVTSTRLRRAIAFHSLLAFTYNAVIIALLVSALLGAVR
jgi:uncharacterized membrane protein